MSNIPRDGYAVESHGSSTGGKRPWKKAATAVVSVITLAVAALYAGIEASLRELSRIEPFWLVSAFAVLIAATALAALRFRSVLRAFGYVPDIRTLLTAFFIGQVSHVFLLNVAGQSVTRAALLTSSGIPSGVTVAATFLERILAAGLLFVFATAASIFVLGGLSLDWDAGGATFMWLLSGLGAAVAAGAIAAIRLPGLENPVSRIMGSVLRLWPSVALTLGVQVLTLCVWVALVHGITGSHITLTVVGALIVVMFASKLPVSFGGWGLRELSAGYALGAVGIAPSAAVAAAIAMGLLSLVLVVASGGVAAGLMRHRGAVPAAATDARGPLSQIDMARTLPVIGVVTVGILLFFQVKLPTDSSALTVNLGDLGAVTAGGLMLVYLVKNRFVVKGLTPMLIWLAAFTAVMAMALVVGYLEYGLNDWAIWNRGVGWLVLLGYFSAGVAARYAVSDLQARVLLGTIVAGGLAVAVLQLAVVSIGSIGLLGVRSEFVKIPIQAFSGNQNAFAVQLVAIFALAAAAYRSRLLGAAWLIATIGIVGASTYFTFSRSGYGMTVIAIGLVLITAPRERRWTEVAHVAWGLVLASLVVVVMRELPSIYQYLADLLSGTGSAGGPNSEKTVTDFSGDMASARGGSESADAERWQSFIEGWRLWLQHPVLGSGLGRQVEAYAEVNEKPLIIHNTPLWLLAETGIIGLTVVAVGAFGVLAWCWRALGTSARAGWALGLAIILFAVGASSMVHELFFQRFCWFLLGLFLALGERYREAGASQKTEHGPFREAC